jgi:hypothetical protein
MDPCETVHVAEEASVHKTTSILTFSAAFDYLPEIAGLAVTVPAMNRQPISYTANNPSIEKGTVEQVICVASRRSSLDNTRHARKFVRFCGSLYVSMSEEADTGSTMIAGRNVNQQYDLGVADCVEKLNVHACDVGRCRGRRLSSIPAMKRLAKTRQGTHSLLTLHLNLARPSKDTKLGGEDWQG